MAIFTLALIPNSIKGSAIKLDKTISLGNELNGLYLLKIKTANKLYQQKILKN